MARCMTSQDIGRVCYMRVRVVDIIKAADGMTVEEVVVESCDRAGKPLRDFKREDTRWYYVWESELIPATVAADERRTA